MVMTRRPGNPIKAASVKRTIPGVSIRAPSMQTITASARDVRTAALMAVAGDRARGLRTSRKVGPCDRTRASSSGGSEPTSTAITSYASAATPRW